MLKKINEQFPDVLLFAFPSQDFGNQEFLENAKIVEFAKEHGPSDLKVFILDHVKNEPVRQTYSWLSKEIGGAFDSGLVWNFKGKFIIDKNGKPHTTSDPLKDLPKYLEECAAK